MSRLFLSCLLCLSMPCMAQMYEGEYAACNQGSTVSIVDCVSAATKRWDKRLNSSYKKLMQRSDPAQQDPLKVAQRAWIKYRDANCGFYGARDGTIRQIEAAECFRSMTRARTCEIEAANRQEGGPEPGCK